ncbi:MAG TPA: penicillin-binding transpeptidase domain-containing protein [Flavobacterium sp.]|jgi:beta-lactamase class D
MKLKLLILWIVSTAILSSCTSRNGIAGQPNVTDRTIVRKDFKNYFEGCNVEGSIVIYDNNKKQWIFSDSIDIHKETLPASSFKIINLLIALETKVIADENEVVNWVGTVDTVKYGYRPEIYHDMTVKEAFRVSAGWVFIELAKKIGRENYKKYLKGCNYGNLDLSERDPDFWNFGNFAISPINQVDFIRKLYEGTLPFSKRNIEILKRVLPIEQGDHYTIHSKTGWARDKGINTGWWVGYLKNSDGVYFFATRILNSRKNQNPKFGECRKSITRSVFRDLSIIR